MNTPGPQNPHASRCVPEVALNSSFLVNTENKIVRPFLENQSIAPIGPQNPLASRCILEVALNSSFLVNTANKIARPFSKTNI